METKALDYGSPRMEYENPSVEYGSAEASNMMIKV